MSVDLKELRQLAEKLCRELGGAQLTWEADRQFVHSDDCDTTEIAEVLEPLAYRWMLARYIATASPRAVLELLDRLERAERKLSVLRDRVLHQTDYRDEMLALLDPEGP